MFGTSKGRKFQTAKPVTTMFALVSDCFQKVSFGRKDQLTSCFQEKVFQYFHESVGIEVPDEVATCTTRTDLGMLGIGYIKILSEDRRLFIVTNMATYNSYNILNSGKYSFRSGQLPERPVTEWLFHMLVFTTCQLTPSLLSRSARCCSG